MKSEFYDPIKKRSESKLSWMRCDDVDTSILQLYRDCNLHLRVHILSHPRYLCARVMGIAYTRTYRLLQSKLCNVLYLRVHVYE